MRPYAERVEASVTDFERHLIFTDPSRNRKVRVACPASAAHRLMAAGLLDKFHARYPALADRAVPGSSSWSTFCILQAAVCSK